MIKDNTMETAGSGFCFGNFTFPLDRSYLTYARGIKFIPWMKNTHIKPKKKKKKKKKCLRIQLKKIFPVPCDRLGDVSSVEDLPHKTYVSFYPRE